MDPRLCQWNGNAWRSIRLTCLLRFLIFRLLSTEKLLRSHLADESSHPGVLGRSRGPICNVLLNVRCYVLLNVRDFRLEQQTDGGLLRREVKDVLVGVRGY